MANDNTAVATKKNGPTLKNNNGSVIVIVIILLALLTIVGISATNMSVSESYITRNAAIARQNLYLTDMAAQEGARWLLTQGQVDTLMLNPNASDNDWLNPIDPNQNPDDLILTSSNSTTPALTTADGTPTMADGSNPTPIGKILADRGEITDGKEQTLRYYFVGWSVAQGNSLKVTKPTWHSGKVIGSYDSPDYGTQKIEWWIQEKF